MPQNVMNAVNRRLVSFSGIWKKLDVKSAMEKRDGRKLLIRSIFFSCSRDFPSLVGVTLLRLRKSTVNLQRYVGLRTKWTCDQQVAFDGSRSKRSSIIFVQGDMFPTEIWRDGNRFVSHRVESILNTIVSTLILKRNVSILSDSIARMCYWSSRES